MSAISSFKEINRMLETTYFSCRGMQHANVLPRHNVDQFTRFDMSDLYEVGLKCENVGIRECE